MTGQLARNPGWALTGGEIVDGANVVKTAAGNVVAAWGVGAGHDPRRAKRNRVNLVCGVCIPNDQLSILRGRNEMPAVSRPMHRVDFGQMPLQGALRLHREPRQGLDALPRDIAYCAGN